MPVTLPNECIASCPELSCRKGFAHWLHDYVTTQSEYLLIWHASLQANVLLWQGLARTSSRTALSHYDPEMITKSTKKTFPAAMCACVAGSLLKS